MLPRDLGSLAPVVARARDSRELYRELAGLGWTAIVSEGPCDPPPAWSEIVADVYLDFWARCTRPAAADAAGRRTWKLTAGPGRRPLALDEPPALVEWTRTGTRLLARGRAREALAEFMEIRGRVAGLPALYAGLAAALAKLGDLPAAERAMAVAIVRGGLHPDLFDTLGDILAAAGRPPEAARALEQAAGLDPGNAARWRKASRALLAAGLDEEALRCDARARALESR